MAGLWNPLSFVFASANPVIEVGSGSGLLEQLLYKQSNGMLNIYGIEVPSCVNKYLPVERVLRVPNVRAVHSEALLAETLLFVYPRTGALIAEYLRFSSADQGVCKQLMVISTQSEYCEIGDLIATYFTVVHKVDFSGLREYEVLAIASLWKKAPRTPPNQPKQVVACVEHADTTGAGRAAFF